MPTIERNDAPGSWHHVSNGGIAQRTIFETEADFRYFLAQVAAAVRRGEIEVHAFCLLGNHFHLQVRSLRGEGGLCAAMRRIQSVYARRFNAAREREGPLFTPRFWSERVDTVGYRRSVLAYLDANVVDGGLADRAVDYPYCSAYGIARGCAPRWLATWWIDELISKEAAAGVTCPIERYLSVSPAMPPAQGSAGWIKLRTKRAHAARPDDLEHLEAATTAGIDRWLSRNAIAADGPTTTRPAMPAAKVIERFMDLEPPTGSGTPGRRGIAIAASVAVALDHRAMLIAALRVLARVPQREIGARLAIGRGAVRGALERHKHNMTACHRYAETFADAVHKILAP